MSVWGLYNSWWGETRPPEWRAGPPGSRRCRGVLGAPVGGQVHLPTTRVVGHSQPRFAVVVTPDMHVALDPADQHVHALGNPRLRPPLRTGIDHREVVVHHEPGELHRHRVVENLNRGYGRAVVEARIRHRPRGDTAGPAYRHPTPCLPVRAALRSVELGDRRGQRPQALPPPGRGRGLAAPARPCPAWLIGGEQVFDEFRDLVGGAAAPGRVCGRRVREAHVECGPPGVAGAALWRACRRRGIGYDPRHHSVKVRIIHLGRGGPAGEHCGCARPHRLERVPRHPHAITSCIPFWGWFCPWGSACRNTAAGWDVVLVMPSPSSLLGWWFPDVRADPRGGPLSRG